MPDLRQPIQSALQAFASAPLRQGSHHLLGTLGYKSDRTLPIDTVATLKAQLDPNGYLCEENAHLSLWKSVHLLFQLTRFELAPSSAHDVALGLGLNLETPFELRRDGKVIESYIFFAIDLHSRADGQPHTRETYGNITRALNRLVPQPVLVLFREDARLSLAVINRRRNLRDGTRDVLTRVSLIRDIDFHSPHRAHLDLLQRFSLASLSAESAIRTFTDLDTAWQEILSVEELKDSFYKSLAAWFRWARREIHLAQLPDHTPDTPANRTRATDEFTVRLICRTLFTWFLKEMRLIPAELLELYDTAENRRVLTKDSDSRAFLDGNHYYRGILQNIFFQSLNRPMDQRRKSGYEAANDREVTDSELKKLVYVGKQNLPADFAYSLFDRIPYLNGGLFDALPEDNLKFTHEEGNAFKVPNKLFYARREDGFTLPGEGARARPQSMEGLNRIFDRYRFTVAENTPLEEDVALDPELLGLVFENLLAEIDPDDEAAAKSARKASGSYYTPRRIVDYMVNEALHLHLRTEFEKDGATAADLQLLSQLCYDLDPHADYLSIAGRVVDALEAVRVLDPACGSGAFPMGMLHRMVELLRRVDPKAELWKQRLLARIPAVYRARIAEEMEGQSYNYLRKLGLIQKNLYGLDIQPLATLIAKLRFFLTLVVEQEVHLADPAHNYGLSSLPNLETNLICANTLADVGHGLLSSGILTELRQAREEYYQPATSRQRRDELATSIGEKLASLFPGFAEKAKGVKPAGATPMDRENMRRQQDAYWLAEWFKHATIAAPFFNVETFFPELVTDGERHPAPFHIVIGNPPYGGTKIPDEVKDALGLGSKDPYGAFIARFMGDPSRPSPLADGGVLSYIVSDTFMTIKTHRPLREQMLRHRIHKMIRVSGDTFKATVNCAVILCQRGTAPETHTCQMADLTNVSIHDRFEYFIHLLYQTEGFTRRATISNQTYAIYHYRQSLIATNSNLPFFVASPKLFALMNDTTAPVNHENIGGKRVPVRSVTLNGNAVRLVKLGDIAEVKVGLQTGDNDAYLFQNPDARGSYRSVEDYREFLLTDRDLERLRSDDSLRSEVVQHGISKDSKKSRRYFGGRYIAPYDKGGESDAEEGFMPNYWVPTDYFIDWSEWAVTRMKTLTLRQKLALQGKSGGDDRPTSRFQNYEFYFVPGLTWSDVGVYSPTIRLSGAGVFDVKGSRFIVPDQLAIPLLGVVCSKLAKMWIKAIENHLVSTQSDNIRELILPAQIPDAMWDQVSSLLAKQKQDARYDYASNEQLEIDRLVYAAYGLNVGDIKEVEDWYARRYPPLAKAQRQNLAAKQGKTEEQLIDRPVIHFYCDESCHLPADGEPNMLLGLLSCPAERITASHAALRDLAKASGLEPHFEAKWTKLSPARLPHYLSLLEWFFAPEQEVLSFRALVLPEKGRLYAALPDTARDHLYYRLYYQLLRGAVEPENRHRIFLDTKDTRGREKVSKLRDLLQRDAGDSLQTARAVQDIQLVRSHEIGLLQLTDLFLGAIAYARRGSQSSPAKLALIGALEEKIGSPLTADTPPGSSKLQIATEYDQDALLL